VRDGVAIGYVQILQPPTVRLPDGFVSLSFDRNDMSTVSLPANDETDTSRTGKNCLVGGRRGSAARLDYDAASLLVVAAQRDDR